MNPRVLVATLIIGLLSCCAGPTAHRMVRPFAPADFVPFEGVGDGNVAGRVYVEGQAVGVRYGASRAVYLIPGAAYAGEWFTESVLGRKVTGVDPRFWKSFRQTTAAADGGFLFENVPPGKYFIKCGIYWEKPATYSATGRFLFGEVDVHSGQTAYAIVTSHATRRLPRGVAEGDW